MWDIARHKNGCRVTVASNYFLLNPNRKNSLTTNNNEHFCSLAKLKKFISYNNFKDNKIMNHL